VLPTSTRLLKVLSLLHSRRFWAGAELAREVGITERSVRRDMERLRSLGYPVHATSGVGGGYELGAGSELPPLPLEDDEAIAVAVGLRAAATGPILGLEEASLRALLKLEKVLPKRLRRQAKALQSVIVQFGSRGPAVDAEWLTVIAGACRDAQLLDFGYVARGGETSQRNVEPYRVVHSASRWYLLAFDPSRADWRTFRLDRIATAPTLGARFVPRPLPDDDVAGWVERQMGDHAYRLRAQVTLHAPASDVTPHVSRHHCSIIPLDERRCRLAFGADSVEELTSFLWYLDVDFEVSGPPELVEHVRRLGTRWSRAAG